VIGVDMRFHGVGELQPESIEFGQIALPGGKNGIDQQGFSGLFASKEIGVSAGNGFEQLFENHDASEC